MPFSTSAEAVKTLQLYFSGSMLTPHQVMKSDFIIQLIAFRWDMPCILAAEVGLACKTSKKWIITTRAIIILCFSAEVSAIIHPHKTCSDVLKTRGSQAEFKVKRSDSPHPSTLQTEGSGVRGPYYFEICLRGFPDMSERIAL